MGIAFSPDAVLRMFRRSLAGIHKRVRLKADDLLTAPAFFNFVYSLISDFEGHEEVAQGGRYYTLPQNWVSSFGEMYSALAGQQVQNLLAAEDGTTMIQFDSGVSCLFAGSRVEFGSGLIAPTYGTGGLGEFCYSFMADGSTRLQISYRVR